MARSIRKFMPVQRVANFIRMTILRRYWGMTIAGTAKISLRAKLDLTYPRGIFIGEWSWLAFGVVVLTHDRTRGLYLDTVVGDNCFIGAHAILMPGVRIGDGSVVGAGSVVTKDIPPDSVAAGNPAEVRRTGVGVGRYGRYANADETTHRLLQQAKYAR